MKIEVNAFDQYKIRRIIRTKKHKVEQLVNIWKKKIPIWLNEWFNQAIKLYGIGWN